MATAKQEKEHIETATERYKRLQERDFDAFLEESFKPEAIQKAVLHLITSPSGMEWQVRRLSSEFYGAAGTIPMSLAARMRSAGKGSGGSGPALTEEEEGRMVEFASQAIRFACVNPRLVDHDHPEPNELPFELVSMGDYKYLAEYLLGEGKEALRLGSFR